MEQKSLIQEPKILHYFYQIRNAPCFEYRKIRELYIIWNSLMIANCEIFYFKMLPNNMKRYWQITFVYQCIERVERYFKSLKKFNIYELYQIMKYLFTESSDLDEYFIEDAKLSYKTFNF